MGRVKRLNVCAKTHTFACGCCGSGLPKKVVTRLVRHAEKRQWRKEVESA